MNENDKLNQIADIIKKQDRIEPPSADVIEPEVRTGTQYAFMGAAAPDNQARVKRGELIGPIVSEWGFDVEFERADAFRKWLSTFEAEIAKACPQGVHYKGTYAVFAS